MLVDLIILGIGLILGVLAVVLRKKLGKEWMISLLCGAVLVAALGGLFTWASWKDLQEDKQHVYIALQYLEHRDVDRASYHLKKVSGDTFASNGAQALLETMRSNTILAQLKLDALDGMAKSDEQRGIAARLAALTPSDDEGLRATAALLRNQLGLSQKRQTEADILFSTESGYSVDGLEIGEQNLSETESLRNEINTALRYGDYSRAVRAAARLVDLSASSGNRLLLAETVAEAIYNGDYLTGYEFLTKEDDIPNAIRERESLQAKIDALALKADDLQLSLDGAVDEEKKNSLTAQQAQLMSDIQTLEGKQNYLFAYRALSAIADQHSLEAAIVRAKLQYAMLNYEDAVKTLCKAANSPAALFTTDASLRDALRLLKKTYSDAQTAGTQSVEFKEAMTTILSSGGNNMISAATSNLTNSFADYIVSSQKSYGKDLYSIGVDTSNYPQVVVTLSGRDTVLEVLKSETDVIVRDTHYDVSYTVKVPEWDDSHMNICCVVDESGSMGGEPTMNLRSALSGFIAALNSNTSIGIVGFENSYTIHAPMSQNHMAAQAAVSQIHASGGTDITAGIRGAMEAMRDCEGRKTVLLMTDGQSDIDMTVVQDAADQGYVIHTIGFGGVNDELLQQIADATGGQYIKADSSTELVNIYLSLVGMIGNEVEIHYTVTEQVEEEVRRYFFVRIPGYEVSLRVEYVLPEAEAPSLDRIWPSLIYESTIADAQASGRSLSLDLYGSFGDITEVSIGGHAADIIEGSSGYLRVEVPAELAGGWQTVTLTQSDGTETSFDQMVCVAQELNASYFRFGDLVMRAGRAALTGDGMLILADDVSVSDEGGDGTGVKTLSLTVSGLLCVPVDADALDRQIAENGPYDCITLNAQGAIEGGGMVRLTADDSGIASDVDGAVARGRFTILFEDGQARLVQN